MPFPIQYLIDVLETKVQWMLKHGYTPEQAQQIVSEMMKGIDVKNIVSKIVNELNKF